MHRHLIDYGFGVAQLWADVPKGEVERTFYRYANQCFGIRKSIMKCDIKERKQEPLPEYIAKVHPDAEVVLKHDGDTIVWGGDPDVKLRSEWD